MRFRFCRSVVREGGGLGCDATSFLSSGCAAITLTASLSVKSATRCAFASMTALVLGELHVKLRGADGYFTVLAYPFSPLPAGNVPLGLDQQVAGRYGMFDG